MLLRILLLTTFNFFLLCFSQSQVELKANGGSFEDLIPWNDGYLGVVQTQAYAVIPKYRQYQYFNSEGKMEWNQKITPFNFNNVSVCNNDSDYAYFINMPFSKTAFLEKTSKTELLNVHRIDREGNISEKAISYTGALSSLKDYFKNLKTHYVAALKDGFIMVFSNDNKKFHIVRVNENFDVNYTNVDFEWDEKRWEKTELSKIKFVVNEKEISLIQIEKASSGLTMDIKTFNLDNLSDMKERTSSIDFSGYTLKSKAGQSSDLLYSAEENTMISYEKTGWRGDYYYTIPTLGAFLNFVSTQEGLKVFTYFKNLKEGTKNEVEKEGFLVFDVSISETERKEMVEFVFLSDDDGSTQHRFHVFENGESVYISRQSKKNIIVKSSKGEEVTFDENLTFAEAFLSYLSGVQRTKSDAVDVISYSNGKYYGIDFDGVTNSLGNSKKAVIYTY